MYVFPLGVGGMLKEGLVELLDDTQKTLSPMKCCQIGKKNFTDELKEECDKVKSFCVGNRKNIL